MRCPFCQNEMGDATDACPGCRRPHAPQVAGHIRRGWEAMAKGTQEEARAAFAEAIRATPPEDKAQIQAYVAYLVEQSASWGSSAPPEGQLPPPGRARTGRPWSGPSIGLSVVLVAVSAPLLCICPSFSRRYGQPGMAIGLALLAALVAAIVIWYRRSNSDRVTGSERALFLHFNEKPLSVVRVMDQARQKQAEFVQARRRRMRMAGLLFPAGLLFFAADLALGYNLFTFSLVGAALWGAGLVGLLLLGRDRPTGKEFGARFDVARTVFQTIRDDLAPRRTLIGWLDLTGPQPGKLVRQGTSPSGAPIHVYRDEWLRMKLALYDGNVMRVSALERVKARLGHWKRGSSGKQKWRAAKSQTRNELRVALTVNRDAYEIVPHAAEYPGKFAVELSREEGRISLVARTDLAVDGRDVLQVLRLAYDQLKPRATQATAGG